MSIHGLLQLDPATLYLFCLLLGATVGSFLNVVIYRLPVMLEQEWGEQCRELLDVKSTDAPDTTPFNLATPSSRCSHCEHEIRPWENIPVVSYLFLKGRCSSCKAAISPRYPLVELVTAVLTLFVVWHMGFTWQAAAALPLTWGLIALSLIDYDHKLLPDIIVIPFLWLGLLLSMPGVFTDSQSAIIGAAAGYLSLWSVFQLFRLLTGKEGMGYGDFKLFALFGAWLGWQYLPLIILISSVVGALVGVVLIVLRGRDHTIPIPFGPYLATAGWISMLWGEQINHAYLTWAGLA
ncbi:prepilin peptidase [Solemya velesiana gill symbiont]|uniref:Prepilin leader peptidase/N-methyltransferase n=1 Tax=Solemya velesiana gill symbiont TaxID=1918948 RepID=A0A1T2KWW3_9GAMM|nr:A24 family peptidase [Solemya velesiana gill symbiont]OOZ37304.1 prepilin peptidase [Solemya velesiana gill symbiont]